MATACCLVQKKCGCGKEIKGSGWKRDWAAHQKKCKQGEVDLTINAN